MSQQYQSLIGFTIGPIGEVMSHSKKSRELWCGSYFFSWYMKELFERINSCGSYEILIPFIGTIPKTRAGIYSDHLIARSIKNKQDTFDEIEDFNKQTLELFSKLIADLKDPSAYSTVHTILKDYLQIKFVVLDYPAHNPKDAELISIIDSHLLAFESNRSFTLGKSTETCQRCNILPSFTKEDIPFEEKNVRLCPICYLKLFHYNNSKWKSIVGRSFPSTGEISTREFKIIDESKYNDFLRTKQKEDINEFEDEDFKKLSSEFGIKLKPYHKYFAIVTADGDGVGSLAKNFTGTSPSDTLSKRLFDYSKSAIDLTNKYNGEMVYCGGDDLLAFMPVVTEKGIQTVIDFVKELSDSYKSIVDKGTKQTSLSVGINIQYYKYPLSIGLDEAYQHEGKAKILKDSVAIQLTQHSGQSTKIHEKFDSHQQQHLCLILNRVLSGSIHLHHAMLHKLIMLKPLLVHITNDDQIKNFFLNHFNEEVHNTSSGINFIRDILIEGRSKYGTAISEVVDNIIQYLRLAEFLRGEDE